MLSARLFRQRVPRLIAFSIILVMTLAIMVPFATRPVLACPEPPPQPLRFLYMQSEQVVVARVGKSEVVRIENEGEEDSQMTYLKTALHVSSTLKGESQPVLYLSHWSYKYYQDPFSNDAEGKTFLLFLKPNESEEEAGTYTIDDMSYGAKQLSDADLKVYVRRIEELAGILKAEKPGDKEIVEWLVRLVEEPATRWEGAYELVTSSYFAEYKEEQARAAQAQAAAAAEASEQQAAAATTEVEAPQPETPEGEEEYYNPYDQGIKAEYFESLTAEQKYRLTTALVNIEHLKDADQVLVELVQKWDDARLVPYLLAQLRQTDSESQYLTDNLMMIVARKIGDESLIAEVDKFRNMEEEEVIAATESSAPESSEEAVVEEPAEAPAVSEAEAQATAEAAEKAAHDALMQKRKVRLERFIALAESAAAKPIAAKTSAPELP